MVGSIIGEAIVRASGATWKAGRWSSRRSRTGGGDGRRDRAEELVDELRAWVGLKALSIEHIKGANKGIARKEVITCMGRSMNHTMGVESGVG